MADPEGAAMVLARLLGDATAAPEGPDGHMVAVGPDGRQVLFAAAPSAAVAPHHLAFRVAGAAFPGWSSGWGCSRCRQIVSTARPG